MDDLRGAYRSLRAAPTVSLFSILSLALGIGSSVATFSIANALLLRTLPVHEPDRLALVAASADGRRSYWASHAAWEQIRDRNVFESAFAWSHKKMDLSERGEADLVDGIFASDGFFDVLGVHPVLGRGLSKEDEGVASAAASVAIPIGFRAMIAVIEIPDDPSLSENDRTVHKNLVTPDWFRTFGTRLLAGRDFDSGDREGEGRVAIVNQIFARRFLEGREPIGLVVRESSGSELRIVGLVEDAVYRSVREPAPPTIYVPLTQETSEAPVFNLIVRPEAGSPALLSRSVAEAIASVEPDLALTLRPMERQVSATFNQERILAILAGALGAQALLLASLGLYGVTAHAVGRRRREIGIRIALGADARRVARAVTERIAILVVVGVAAGSALALWTAPVVESLLFGLEPRDPSTFAFASGVLVAVAASAAFFPARRAARLDPASLLRDSSGTGPGS
jgi:hypothetical protein